MYMFRAGVLWFAERHWCGRYGSCVAEKGDQSKFARLVRSVLSLCPVIRMMMIMAITRRQHNEGSVVMEMRYTMQGSEGV